ncbi:MAG: hypothetical protein AB7T37_18505, partial [Dehalococcoidia bacterium]
LVAFSAGTYLATVRYAESLSAVVPNVPVSRGIASAQMVTGRRVAVALFDASQPADAMVVGVF